MKNSSIFPILFQAGGVVLCFVGAVIPPPSDTLPMNEGPARETFYRVLMILSKRG